MKLSAITLGCRVNQYETQAICEKLYSLGFERAANEEDADLYLINTCAVTAESVRKDRQTIRRILRIKQSRENAVICVCGCFPQGEEWNFESNGIDLIAGNSRKSEVAEILFDLCHQNPSDRRQIDLREDISLVRKFESLSVSGSRNARAFIKIEDGCNSFCSYCYVPLVRGRVRSRPLTEIVCEAQRLAANGYAEIVLVGIETGAYGNDFDDHTDLISLVTRLHDISNVKRIRFGSLKPTVFTDDFCSRLSELPKVMPHFHLSFQSGSDKVLSRMGRRYGRDEENRAIDCIRRYYPDVGLSADFICGFPGEKEEDFLQTESLVRYARLLHTHIFPYSPRKGTRAASFSDPVDEVVKRDRCARLSVAARECAIQFHKERIGRTARVLCEKIQNGVVSGYTEEFMYVNVPDDNFRVGEIISLELTSKFHFTADMLISSAKKAQTVDNLPKKL